jgi:glyoxylase-like metal-dependent hydrolase (beta-lactamase superfamily II)
MPVAGEPRQVTPRAIWLLAPNPGPMTFDGTNSWVLHEPGRRGCVVVDPGPDDDRHLSALAEVARGEGGHVEAILLTHGHPDHCAGAQSFGRRTGAAVLAADPRRGDRVIGPGEQAIAGLRVGVVATPGHSSDSLSFHLPADDSILTGDTVLGRSAPAILDPDGRVDQMISSLELLRSVLHGGESVVLPGHGPLVTDPAGQLELALSAREARLAQVAQAVSDGFDTVAAIADRVYGPFDERIRRPIEATVRAHVRYLRDQRRLSGTVELG